MCAMPVLVATFYGSVPPAVLTSSDRAIALADKTPLRLPQILRPHGAPLVCDLVPTGFVVRQSRTARKRHDFDPTAKRPSPHHVLLLLLRVPLASSLARLGV